MKDKGINMDVGKRIRTIRVLKGMTTTELASSCNVSQAVISKLEHNKRIADIHSIEIICNTFGITLSEFFAEDDLPPYILDFMGTIRKLEPEQVKALHEMVKTFMLQDKE